jgi:hypothetical protein
MTIPKTPATLISTSAALALRNEEDSNPLLPCGEKPPRSEKILSERDYVRAVRNACGGEYVADGRLIAPLWRIAPTRPSMWRAPEWAKEHGSYAREWIEFDSATASLERPRKDVFLDLTCYPGTGSLIRTGHGWLGYWKATQPRPDIVGSCHNDFPDHCARAWALGIPAHLYPRGLAHALPERWAGGRERIHALQTLSRRGFGRTILANWAGRLKTADLRRLAHVSRDIWQVCRQEDLLYWSVVTEGKTTEQGVTQYKIDWPALSQALQRAKARLEAANALKPQQQELRQASESSPPLSVNLPAPLSLRHRLELLRYLDACEENYAEHVLTQLRAGAVALIEERNPNSGRATGWRIPESFVWRCAGTPPLAQYRGRYPMQPRSATWGWIPAMRTLDRFSPLDSVEGVLPRLQVRPEMMTPAQRACSDALRRAMFRHYADALATLASPAQCAAVIAGSLVPIQVKADTALHWREEVFTWILASTQEVEDCRRAWAAEARQDALAQEERAASAADVRERNSSPLGMTLRQVHQQSSYLQAASRWALYDLKEQRGAEDALMLRCNPPPCDMLPSVDAPSRDTQAARRVYGVAVKGESPRLRAVAEELLSTPTA